VYLGVVYCPYARLFLQNMTAAEENYLKAIFKLSQEGVEVVSTNAIAAQMKTSAASVTDMIKRLAEKQMVVYVKYKGVELTAEGNAKAKEMVRNHRIWEVFLVEKLNFGWDEIHDIAEQLEHIKSKDLIMRLDSFLGFPRFDPHGDPIPDAQGEMQQRSETLLSELPAGESGIVVGVKDTSSSFLQHLDKMEIELGTSLTITDRVDYDGSLELKHGDRTISVSERVAQNIYVKQV